MQDRNVGHIRDQQDIIDEEAARWVVLLSGGSVRDEDRDLLQGWLSADPRHRAAFTEARQTWAEFGAMGELRRTADGTRAQRQPLPVGYDRRAARSGSATAVVALAACLVVAVATAFFLYGDPAVLLRADYRTAPGESRTVQLSDGSVVDLGSGSAIALHFSDRERRIELLSGRAYFTASPRTGPETRPFVVASSVGTATALGTQFSVDRIDDAVEVAVAEHSVAVDLDDGKTRASVVLNEGQAVRYGPEGGMSRVETRDIAQTTAWRRGKIIFSDVPLSHVIAELNRYRRGRIVIASDRLAGLKVSGVFDTNDLSSALGRIVSELDLSMSSVPPLITVIY